MSNCYKVLGVAATASHAEIKTAYRRKVRENHPDLGGDIKKFRKVQEAWETIETPTKRAAYDQTHAPRATTSPNDDTQFARKARMYAEARMATEARDRPAGLFEDKKAWQEMRDEQTRLINKIHEDMAKMNGTFAKEDTTFKEEYIAAKWSKLGAKYNAFRTSTAEFFLVQQWKRTDSLILKTVLLTLIPINIAVFVINFINMEPSSLFTLAFIVASFFALFIDAIIISCLIFGRKVVWEMRKMEYMKTKT